MSHLSSTTPDQHALPPPHYQHFPYTSSCVPHIITLHAPTFRRVPPHFPYLMHLASHTHMHLAYRTHMCLTCLTFTRCIVHLVPICASHTVPTHASRVLPLPDALCISSRTHMRLAYCTHTCLTCLTFTRCTVHLIPICASHTVPTRASRALPLHTFTLNHTLMCEWLHMPSLPLNSPISYLPDQPPASYTLLDTPCLPYILPTHLLTHVTFLTTLPLHLASHAPYLTCPVF